MMWNAGGPARFPVDMRSLRDALVAAWACGVLLPGAAAGQRDDAAATFADVIDVRVVNVEVVVTDEQGRRVHGLTAPDFELLVDGRPVPLDYFSEIREGRAVAAPAGDLTTAPAARPNSPVGTNFLVFIDDFFSIKRDRDRVLDGLEDDLAKLAPSDRVAIVAFDGTSITKLTDWTRSADRLTAALEEARGREAYGLNRLQERMASDTARGEQILMRREGAEALMRHGESRNGSTGEPLTLLQARNPQARRGRLEDTSGDHDVRSTLLDGVSETAHDGSLDLLDAARLERQLARSVLAATATIRGFADASGRRAMLLLASGWPESAAAFIAAGLPSSADRPTMSSDDGLMNRDTLYGPLMSAANLTGYTLYPVDVPGFSPESPIDASLALDVRDEPEAALLSDTDPTRPIGATQAADSTLLLKRETLQHAALQRLADATGGLAMIDDQRDSALAAAVADTRSYYWLGVQPRRREDDGAHDIEARLADRPGLSLRTREGYVDLSPQAEVLTAIDTALIFGDPPSTTPLRVRLGQPERAGRRLRMAAELAVPLNHIVFLKREGMWRAELEVWIAATDETGNRSETVFQTFQIAGDQPPEPGQIHYIETGLELRRRQTGFVIAVLDPRSGAILTSSGTIDRR
jgi:VWFA-related protein